ncbi:MAG: EF-hand domain-containing protein [Candidatus Nitrosoglobus sp.]
MRAANHKIMRYSIFFGGVLSLILAPAFAGDQPFPDNSYRIQKTGTAEGMKMHHEDMFQKMDKNGDGKISKQEFEEAANNKFERMDTNKDGYISKAEFEAAAKKWKEKHHRGNYKEGT